MAEPKDPKKKALVAWLFAAHGAALRRRLTCLRGGLSPA